MVRVANSAPMVLALLSTNSLRVNRDKTLVLPTPDSPQRTIWDALIALSQEHAGQPAEMTSYLEKRLI